MKPLRLASALASAFLLFALPAFDFADNHEGHGRAVLTILPSGSGDQAATVTPEEVKIKVDGKDSSLTRITPLRGPQNPIELMILIDGSARSSIGGQFNDIGAFVKEMPSNAKTGIAYMENGRAAIMAPLSSDSADVLKGLRLPTGSAGSNGSPYFCLSDLANHWPSSDRSARREVVMITDGVDNYERRFDANDPYVDAAINDSIRSGVIVYSMYWRDTGRVDANELDNNAGQSFLQMVTQATGGYSFGQGIGNPVSFQPFFDDLRRRLNHQYELRFSAPFNGKPQVRNLKVELRIPSAKVEAPQRVWVSAGNTAIGE